MARVRSAPEECWKGHAWYDEEAVETFCERENCGRRRRFLGFGNTDERTGQPKKRFSYTWLPSWAPGMAVRLVSWACQEEDIPAGTPGVVVEILANGVIMIDWDGYGKLGVIPEADVIEAA